MVWSSPGHTLEVVSLGWSLDFSACSFLLSYILQTLKTRAHSIDLYLFVIACIYFIAMCVYVPMYSAKLTKQSFQRPLHPEAGWVLSMHTGSSQFAQWVQ